MNFPVPIVGDNGKLHLLKRISLIIDFEPIPRSWRLYCVLTVYIAAFKEKTSDFVVTVFPWWIQQQKKSNFRRGCNRRAPSGHLRKKCGFFGQIIQHYSIIPMFHHWYWTSGKWSVDWYQWMFQESNTVNSAYVEFSWTWQLYSS